MERRQLRTAWLSDTGRQRTDNEDLVCVAEELGLYAVIDGVGGENAGEKAARIAADIVVARMRRATGAVGQRLKEAITLANNEIYSQSKANRAFDGMACVMSVAVIDGERLTVGQVGDSRLYLIQEGGIRKITRDHSLVGQLEEAGQISESEAMRHPRRHEIMRDVGSDPRELDDANFVDITEIRFDRDAALLLCSDGLTDMVGTDVLRSTVLGTAGEPRVTVEKLVEAANLAGGKDNISVIVIEGEDFAARVRPGFRPDDGRKKPAGGNGAAAGSRAPAASGGSYAQPAKRGSLLRSFLILAAWLAALAAGYYYATWREHRAGATLRVGPGAAYATIEAALDKAAPGDTVLVAAGTYPESVRLRSGVRVRAERRHQATLKPPAGKTGVIATDAQNASFEGLRIELDAGDPAGVGIRLVDAEVLVEGVAITGAALTAIESLGSDRSTIRGAELRENPGHGLRVGGAAEPLVESSFFAGNGKRGKAAQIKLEGEAAPILRNNRLHKGEGATLEGGSAQLQQDFLEWNVAGDRPAAPPR